MYGASGFFADSANDITGIRHPTVRRPAQIGQKVLHRDRVATGRPVLNGPLLLGSLNPIQIDRTRLACRRREDWLRAQAMML